MAVRRNAVPEAEIQNRAFETIVFDLDGTLVDSVVDVANAVNRVLSDSSLALIEESSRRQLLGEGARIRIRKAFAMRGSELSETELDSLTRDFNRYYSDALTDNTKPYEEVADVLQTLGSDGFRLAVCTNKDENSARKVLTALGLMPPIEDVAGPDTFGVQKPNPRHLLGLVEKLGGNATSTLMVGDSSHDVETARAAGIPVAVVDWGYTSVPASQLGGDYLLRRFSDLLKIVNK